MAYLIKILLVSSSVVALMTFSGCGYNKKIWNEVTTYFGNGDLTGDDIKKKVSYGAISSITNGDTANFTVKVKGFFMELSKSANYNFERNGSLVYVIFNRNDKIAGGPTIEIKSVEKDWYISDVRFGK